jgi:hypothetical protein
MSSEVILNCWICPETFSKTRALKYHANGKHYVCKMVCPWCIHDERTFAGISELTKHNEIHPRVPNCFPNIHVSQSGKLKSMQTTTATNKLKIK